MIQSFTEISDYFRPNHFLQDFAQGVTHVIVMTNAKIRCDLIGSFRAQIYERCYLH